VPKIYSMKVNSRSVGEPRQNMERSGQPHVLAVLSLGSNPRYPFNRRLCGLRTLLEVVTKRTWLESRIGWLSCS